MAIDKIYLICYIYYISKEENMPKLRKLLHCPACGRFANKEDLKEDSICGKCLEEIPDESLEMAIECGDFDPIRNEWISH